MNNEKLALEAIAREVRALSLDYAAMHFDGKDHMLAPSYVAEYLRSLKDAPIDVSGLAAAQPASAGSVGDDAEFQGFIGGLVNAEYDNYMEYMAKLVAYIDSRPRQADQQASADFRGAGELPELPEPLEIDWPQLNSQALGCGVEDRNLHDRYDCANYGWQDGMDAAASCVPDAIYDADQMHEFGARQREAGRRERDLDFGLLELGLEQAHERLSHADHAIAERDAAALVQQASSEAQEPICVISQKNLLALKDGCSSVSINSLDSELYGDVRLYAAIAPQAPDTYSGPLAIVRVFRDTADGDVIDLATTGAQHELLLTMDGAELYAVPQAPDTVRDDGIRDAAMEECAVICHAVGFTTDYPSSNVAARCASEIRSAIAMKSTAPKLADGEGQ